MTDQPSIPTNYAERWELAEYVGGEFEALLRQRDDGLRAHPSYSEAREALSAIESTVDELCRRHDGINRPKWAAVVTGLLFEWIQQLDPPRWSNAHPKPLDFQEACDRAGETFWRKRYDPGTERYAFSAGVATLEALGEMAAHFHSEGMSYQASLVHASEVLMGFFRQHRI